jgi:hypothetical protein
VDIMLQPSGILVFLAIQLSIYIFIRLDSYAPSGRPFSSSSLIFSIKALFWYCSRAKFRVC